MFHKFIMHSCLNGNSVNFTATTAADLEVKGTQRKTGHLLSTDQHKMKVKTTTTNCIYCTFQTLYVVKSGEEVNICVYYVCRHTAVMSSVFMSANLNDCSIALFCVGGRFFQEYG